MEFTEVFKQAQRMCKELQCCCSRCPISDDEGFCLVKPWANNVDPDEAERRVMAWAKENPEPVYPKWGEWLISVGAARKIPEGIPFELHDGRIVDSPLETVVDVNSPIPADIAEKLGIEPKEAKD